MLYNYKQIMLRIYKPIMLLPLKSLGNLSSRLLAASPYGSQMCGGFHEFPGATQTFRAAFDLATNDRIVTLQEAQDDLGGGYEFVEE